MGINEVFSPSLSLLRLVLIFLPSLYRASKRRISAKHNQKNTTEPFCKDSFKHYEEDRQAFYEQIMKPTVAQEENTLHPVPRRLV